MQPHADSLKIFSHASVFLRQQWVNIEESCKKRAKEKKKLGSRKRQVDIGKKATLPFRLARSPANTEAQGERQRQQFSDKYANDYVKTCTLWSWGVWKWRGKKQKRPGVNPLRFGACIFHPKKKVTTRWEISGSALGQGSRRREVMVTRTGKVKFTWILTVSILTFFGDCIDACSAYFLKSFFNRKWQRAHMRRFL